MWQSQVENVHYSRMQLLTKTRFKIIIFVGLEPPLYNSYKHGTKAAKKVVTVPKQ